MNGLVAVSSVLKVLERTVKMLKLQVVGFRLEFEFAKLVIINANFSLGLCRIFMTKQFFLLSQSLWLVQALYNHHFFVLHRKILRISDDALFFPNRCSKLVANRVPVFLESRIDWDCFLLLGDYINTASLIEGIWVVYQL